MLTTTRLRRHRLCATLFVTFCVASSLTAAILGHAHNLSAVGYTSFSRHGNSNGVPNFAEDVTLNGIADVYEDVDRDGTNNLFDKGRPAATGFAGVPGQCADGLDNDADGLIDRADPDCAGSARQREGGPGPSTNRDPPFEDLETYCADGLDNDADGLIDRADPDCAGLTSSQPPAGQCSDGLENDADGHIDRADPGCSCNGERPAESACPASTSSSTSSARASPAVLPSRSVTRAQTAKRR